MNIRNLPDEIHRELRLRAARHNRSMEAEARAILGDACRPSKSLGEAIIRIHGWIDEQYGPDKLSGVVDELIRKRRESAMFE